MRVQAAPVVERPGGDTTGQLRLLISGFREPLDLRSHLRVPGGRWSHGEQQTRRVFDASGPRD